MEFHEPCGCGGSPVKEKGKSSHYSSVDGALDSLSVASNAEGHLLVPCAFNSYMELSGSLRAAIREMLRRGTCGGIISVGLDELDAVLSEYSSLPEWLQEDIVIAAAIDLEKRENILDGELYSALKRAFGKGLRGVVLTRVVENLEQASQLIHVIRRNTVKGHDVLIALQVSTTREELFNSKIKYGKYPVEVLHNSGLLDKNTLLLCPGWVASWELEIIARQGASIVVCPSLQAYIADSSLLHYNSLEERGILGGIGTGKGVLPNPWLEAWLYTLLQRQVYGSSVSIDYDKAFRLATRKPPQVLIERLGRTSSRNMAAYPGPGKERPWFTVLLEEKPYYIITGFGLKLDLDKIV